MSVEPSSPAMTAPGTPPGPGVRLLGDGRAEACVWAPRATHVEVVVDPDGDQRLVPLAPAARGWHVGLLEAVAPGTRYRYRLHRGDEGSVDRADPASRFQPEGVHGPSAIDDPGAFPWTDASFRAPPLHEQLVYELHVGTFTPAGTFDAVAARLDHLVDLGVTTIELLPVWQFPGTRNWGYDGVLPFAVQDSYGGPDGLRRLVDAAHGRGIGVWLDVVYNHLGPEGNHLADLGPYLTEHRGTPWGPGLNTDTEDADGVRRWVIEHGVACVRELHLDGFRLDAVHGIVDTSAVHLLEEYTAAVKDAGAALGKPIHVVAESDLCDPRLVRAPAVGGYGMDAQWLDDFHHAVHVALTGERDGYYVDHHGLEDLPTLYRDRYLHAGRYSEHRRRTVGRPARDVAYDRFVVCVQNHDQVGNRMLGERLTALTDRAGLELAATLLLTSPYVPMLWMGEEYAESAPFRYFVSHTDPELVEAVRRGRREEFASFAWRAEAPDPQAEETFRASTIDLGLAHDGGDHQEMFSLYRELIAMRRRLPVLYDPTGGDVAATLVPGRQAIGLHRRGRLGEVVVAANAEDDDVEVVLPSAAGDFEEHFTTAGRHHGGEDPAGAARSDGAVLTIPLTRRSARVFVRAGTTTRLPT
ncbi:MAG: malto-oligosyltrehalose trehalohydrolase [Nitriliruptoraceae bacterium]